MSGASTGDWHNDPDLPKIDFLRAAYDGNKEKMQDLMRAGVHVDATDDDDVTALQVAAHTGNVAMVDFLLSLGADIDFPNKVGMTAFHHACREGRLDAVNHLLQRGANAVKETKMGASALTLAVAGGHFEIVVKLYSIGLDANAQQGLCPSPLIMAALKSSPQICGYLVRNCQAKVDATIDGLLNLSALSCALMCSTPQVFTALLDLNADPYKRTLKNRTIYELADKLHKRPFIEILNGARATGTYAERPDVKELLLRGKVVDVFDRIGTTFNDGFTVLMYSTLIDNNLAVRQLLSTNAVDELLEAAENTQGLRALHLAALLRLEDVVAVLLSHRANVRAKTKTSSTPFDLYLAFPCDVEDVIKKSLMDGKGRKAENRLSLSSNSASLARSLHPKPKEWFSRVTSPFLVADRAEDTYLTPKQYFDARVNSFPYEGRHYKRLVRSEELLNRTRSLTPPRHRLVNDAPIEVAKAIAIESQSFLVSCFYDQYHREDGKTEDWKQEDYDIAMVNAKSYGYKNRPSTGLVRREEEWRGAKKLVDTPSVSHRNTPRMVKKGRDMEEQRMAHSAALAPHLHETLRKSSSNPMMMIHPTVVPSFPGAPTFRATRIPSMRQALPIHNHIWKSLRERHVPAEVFEILERNEITGESFLLCSADDLRNIGVSSDIIPVLVDVQGKFLHTAV